ncbi:MAG: hypothetical protein CMF59_14920 [Leptospiraceae bacterium]|nr:hypothetical protein [Leptospiraceae bacterium]|tara:strand:+ start:266 stop:508 length:243 start_codon:yes stop_codon:yes gene_type:complete
MAREIPLMVPDIGDAEKIEIVSWNVEQGDKVTENQELCELVTDKAAFPLECPDNGTLKEIKRKAGESVKIGDTLAILEIQ